MSSILPPNANQQERDIEAVISGFALPDIKSIWNAETCPAQLLQHLAWALSVDEWDGAWPEKTKREYLATQYEIHRYKGTPGGVKRAIAAAGYEDAEIIEGLHLAKYNGVANYDGNYSFGAEEQWATYIVILDRAITNVQAVQIKRILSHTAPVRSELISLDFQAVANTYNAASSYDGAYNYGSV
mgnify:CR=1 FL=1